VYSDYDVPCQSLQGTVVLNAIRISSPSGGLPTERKVNWYVDTRSIEPRNALELYLADKEGTLSQSSIRSHRWRVSTFVDWLDERGTTNMNELTGRLVKEEYQLDGRKANDWAPSTEKSMMTTIRVFIRWCEGIEAVESGSPSASNPDNFRRRRRSRRAT